MIPSIKNERSTSVKKKYLAIGLLTTSLLLTNNVMAKTDIQGGGGYIQVNQLQVRKKQ